MFQPRYQISPHLLDQIKQITLLVHELNKRAWPDIILTQFQAEAETISTYASTSIEGNPLPLTEVKRLLKNQPEQVRQSEREVLIGLPSAESQASLKRWLEQRQVKVRDDLLK